MALPDVLALCVARGIRPRVASWVRGARPNRCASPRSGWEPALYYGGRPQLRADRVDVRGCAPGTRHTDPRRVTGAKPSAFAFWLFDLLGMEPGDSLADLYPGSGGISRAWAIFDARGLPVARAGERDVAASSRASRRDAVARIAG